MKVKMGSHETYIKVLKLIYIGAIIIMGLAFNVQFLNGIVNTPSKIVSYENHLGNNHFELIDAVSGSQYSYGYTPVSQYESLEIHRSDNLGFWYMGVSPYYKVYFKGNTVRMSVQNAWIEYELEHLKSVVHGPEENKFSIEEPKIPEVAESVVNKNTLSVSNVFESMDVSYKVDTSLLTEELVLKEFKQVIRVVQKIEWEGITPEYQDDGSIVFADEKGEKIVKILAPFMEDAGHNVCEDVHYEIIETESGCELHKVIDEKGLQWLEHAVYPVVLDPSMQTFEDAWESSGLTPYGQYFRNLEEYVNPANGFLTVAQTDLTIPGRGLDFALSRVYQTPAVFYGSNPYDYEAPPVDLGKGWQLNLPYVGDKYLHLWGGTVYKIEWSGNSFENHKGSHFTLVKNGDSTYTLTMASGAVYEFNTNGYLTQIKDLDQNNITFSYTNGDLTTITDTIGRTINLVYSSGRLWKIVYNNEEIEFSYDGNGCLVWMEDFLDRRTSYFYNTGYTTWLLSKIEYPTTGYTTYQYNRFSDNDYYKYYVTNQRVYETNQVRHTECTYTGSFSEITSSETTAKNESDVIQGFHSFSINDGVITQRIAKNASGTPLKKYVYTYNSKREVTEVDVYNDASHLSYTTYFAYDNWGNIIYAKNAEGHEQLFSYANTNTSGFFIDNTGAVVKQFTNAFSNCTVPSSAHTAMIGIAEKQDNTYVREAYYTYDSEAHITDTKTVFGETTTWLTYSGTFNEHTGDTSFLIDLTGHTVAGNGVLQITGLPSDQTRWESHSFYCASCPFTCNAGCKPISGSWSGKYYSLNYQCCIEGLYGHIHCPTNHIGSIGPFTHYPGTLGYQGYFTDPDMGEYFVEFEVTARWKTYPVKVEYNLDNSAWRTITTNLKNGTAQKTVPLSGGVHTLYFNESSSYDNKFSWTLWVPVDNTPDVYTTSMTYDVYGNMISVTDAQSHTINFTYASDYSHAYLTEISATTGTETITSKATYDYHRGWVTSTQEPKGVAGSGYDTLYTYDALGRIIKREFPLLDGQSERSYIEAVYDCENRTVTIIDVLGHYLTKEFDKLGRLTATKWYTGQYGQGTLYATESYRYYYNNKIKTVTDPGNDTRTYAYDFLGRNTQLTFSDSSVVSYSYDDMNNVMTFTNARNYDRIYWFNWVGQLTKVEEEYEIGLFAQTEYQYNDSGHLTSFTDAESHTTTYEYASLFGLTKVIYPDSSYEEFHYDDMGNLTSFTDSKGNSTIYTYDSVYQLIQIQCEDATTVSFSYDLNGNKIRMDDNAPNTGDYAEYEYDTWNRLSTEIRHIAQDVYTISYQYDEVSRLTNLTYPNGMQIVYSYDDLNRITQVKQYIDGINDDILQDDIQYNEENIPTQFDFGNGLQTIFSYDTRDRPLTIDLKDGETQYLSLDYTYDDNSNIIQLVNGWRDTNMNWNSDTESYTYDGLDRLISANSSSWSHTYSYDKVGNRTSKDSTIYTINSVNQVTELSDGTTFDYDLNGNTIQKTEDSDTWVYTYDSTNRLTKVEKNDTTLGEYEYDGRNMRIQATENNETTTYIYAGVNVLYEENTNGEASYIYGPTGRIAKRTIINNESHTYYYHTDHLGSTRLVTDESKNVITHAAYEPFGESTESEESYLYTGKEKDATGLYYYGARYYDPVIGRFLTKDPLTGQITNPQSLNQYTYCYNNPLNLIDPTGLVAMCNVDTGVCIRFYDSGWIAYKDGEKITDSKEMEELLDPTGKTESERRYDCLRAIVNILQILGYEVDDTNINEANMKIEFEINGVDVSIGVEFMDDDPEWTKRGGAPPPEKQGDPINITIYFKEDMNTTTEQLFHTVGHEMVHAHHYASGKYYKWKKKYKSRYAADALSEMEAYWWNLSHLDIFWYPGAFQEFFNARYRWSHYFYTQFQDG